MRTHFVIITVLWLAAAFATGCAGFEELRGKDYPHSAELNFEAGLKYLQAENYEVAEKYFQLVRTKYSYSMYSTYAELLEADTKLYQDLYMDAIGAYRRFEKRHPTHPCIPYVRYQTGQSYFEQINQDWWFMPPAHEKDQDLTEKALRSFKSLIRLEGAQDYYFAPDFTPETPIRICEGRDYKQIRSIIYMARQNIDFCLERLVGREVYVARFYLSHDKPLGAVQRLEAAFQKYPYIAAKVDLVLLLAKAYREAHMYKKARAVWEWLAVAHPKAVESSEIQTTLAELIAEEGAYTRKREARLAKIAARTEKERPAKELDGIQELDPEPNPNASAEIPLPPLENM